MTMNIPILPKASIDSCIIGVAFKEEIRELTDLGIVCHTFISNAKLSDEISAHADINCINIGDNKILADTDVAGELKGKIQGIELLPAGNVASPYPNDIVLNAFYDGERIFCNSKHISPLLKDFAESNNINLIHTNQGYAKCSICAVSDMAVITEDEALAYLLKIYQYDVLLIKKGYVALSDKHYGFIGGASALIAPDQLYMSGDIGAHPDYELIKDFAAKYNVSLVYNKNRPLTDFGGIINII